MKVPVLIKVYADFECINQPTNTAELAATLSSHDPKVIFKQIPIAVEFYLISPFGNQYCSYFGEACTEGQQSCVTWFVNGVLTLEKFASEYFETNIPLEMTPEEEESFQQFTIWLCESPLGDTASLASQKKFEIMIT